VVTNHPNDLAIQIRLADRASCGVYRRPGTRQPESDSTTDAAARAGNEGDLSSKGKFGIHSASFTSHLKPTPGQAADRR
jgi:hypothetical protein